MRYIYWLLALIIVITMISGGFFFSKLFLYVVISLFLITGASLIFSQKTKSSWKHFPKLLVGSVLYGLLIGITFFIVPRYMSLQSPAINSYFFKFMIEMITDMLIFSGVSAYAIIISGLIMLAIKGLYFLSKSYYAKIKNK